MKKRIIVLAVALVAALPGVADTETVDGIEWHFVVNDGKAAVQGESGITAITNATTGTLIIPSSLGGMPVTSIGYNAFYKCSGLTSVVIPNSVTEIGDSAFYECSGLTSVTIPNSVTNIGDYAFKNCSGLTNLTVSASVKKIGVEAFRGCKGLARNDLVIVQGILFDYVGKGGDVTIPAGVTRIGSSAFYGCSGLTNVVIPAGVKSIGSSGFRDCSALTDVTIPASVTSIGDYAFKNCSGLTNLTVPASVKKIGNEAFRGCSGLASNDLVIVPGILFDYVGAGGDVTIPDCVTKIGNYTFYGCSGLTNAVIPAGVKSIGSSAFRDCTALTDVTIPSSVTSIGSYAFKGCGGLRSVAIPQCVCKSTLKSKFPSSYQAITNVVIQDGVTSIGTSTFKGCSALTSVTIPDGVTKIGGSAFYGCSGLTDLTIPAGVKDIGASAFYKCGGLTNVVFNGDPPKIGGSAFSRVAPGCTVHVGRFSVGWGVLIPGTWKGLWIEYLEANEPDPTELWPLGDLWPSGVEGAVSMSSSSIYEGYLHDGDGVVAGRVTVKVGKPNQKTKITSVKATVVGLNGKKKSLSAEAQGKARLSADGPTEVAFKGDKVFVVKLGAEGMSGSYGDYHIDGSLNVFSAKDETSKAVASAVLDKRQGLVNVAWPGAQGWNWLSMTIAARGKAKVRGILADGKKVSVSSQLIVGEKGVCVPVMYTRGGTAVAKAFAFIVWLQDETGNLSSSKMSVISAEAEARAIIPDVVGISDVTNVVVGRPGNLKGGAKFHMDAVMGDAQYAQYLLDGVPVEGGEKWTLPKPGRVVQLTRQREVVESKLGENPSALKLTYKAKDGSFKGSFKTYTFAGYRLKSTMVKVVGVLVNGVGYGTAAAKGASAPVTIE